MKSAEHVEEDATAVYSERMERSSEVLKAEALSPALRKVALTFECAALGDQLGSEIASMVEMDARLSDAYKEEMSVYVSESREPAECLLSRYDDLTKRCGDLSIRQVSLLRELGSVCAAGSKDMKIGLVARELSMLRVLIGGRGSTEKEVFVDADDEVCLRERAISTNEVLRFLCKSNECFGSLETLRRELAAIECREQTLLSEGAAAVEKLRESRENREPRGDQCSEQALGLFLANTNDAANDASARMGANIEKRKRNLKALRSSLVGWRVVLLDFRSSLDELEKHMEGQREGTRKWGESLRRWRRDHRDHRGEWWIALGLPSVVRRGQNGRNAEEPKESFTCAHTREEGRGHLLDREETLRDMDICLEQLSNDMKKWDRVRLIKWRPILGEWDTRMRSLLRDTRSDVGLRRSEMRKGPECDWYPSDRPTPLHRFKDLD